jgi:hypothetical protein
MAYILRGQGVGSGVNANSANHVQTTADFAVAAWNTVAKHEVFTVSGMVRLYMWVECTENVAGAGSIQFGHEDATNAFIASTTGTDLDAGYLWYDATPAAKLDTAANAILDYVVIGVDVGYEITGAVLSDGNLVFHCVWEPLSVGASVVAGTGVSL